MQQAGSGVIVHVAARRGVEPAAGAVAYGASKAAFVHLTRMRDVELRPHGIRVNVVVPQVIATRRTRRCSFRKCWPGPSNRRLSLTSSPSSSARPPPAVSGAVVPTYGG
jgi:NAD(P)-dependent dehydrogenase (short-subunit alcohol dehydrogenase family)